MGAQYKPSGKERPASFTMYGYSGYRSYTDNGRYSDDLSESNQLSQYDATYRSYSRNSLQKDMNVNSLDYNQDLGNPSSTSAQRGRFGLDDRDSNLGQTSRSVDHYDRGQAIRSQGQSNRSLGQSNRSLDEYDYEDNIHYRDMNTTSNDYRGMSSLDNYGQRDVFDMYAKKSVDSYGEPPMKFSESYRKDWGAPADTFDSRDSARNQIGKMTRDDSVGQEQLKGRSYNDSKPMQHSGFGITTNPRSDVISRSIPPRNNQSKNVNKGFTGGGAAKRRAAAKNKIKMLNEKRQTSAYQSNFRSPTRRHHPQPIAPLLSAEADACSLKLKQELELREQQLAMASNLLTKQTQLLQNIESNIQTQMVTAAPKIAPGNPRTADPYSTEELMNRFDSRPPRHISESGSREPQIDQQGRSGLGLSKKAMKRMRRRLRKESITSQDLALQPSRVPMKRGIDQGGDMMMSMAPPTKKMYMETSHNEMPLFSMDIGVNRPNLSANRIGSKCPDCSLPITDENHSNSRHHKMWMTKIWMGCKPCGIIKFQCIEDCRSHFQKPEHNLVMRYIKRDLIPKTKFHKVNFRPEKFSETKSFGEKYFVKTTGMFCELCKIFFHLNEKKCKNHLKTKTHYDNWVNKLKLKKFKELLEAEVNQNNEGKHLNDDKKITKKLGDLESKTLNKKKSDPEDKKTMETQSADTVDCKVGKEKTSEDTPVEKTEEKDVEKSDENGDAEKFHPVVENADESISMETIKNAETMDKEAERLEHSQNIDDSMKQNSDSVQNQNTTSGGVTSNLEEARTSAGIEENSQEAKEQEVANESPKIP